MIPIHKNIVAKNIHDSILNKGEISEAFSHNIDIKYEKTGKEIKEKLLAKLMDRENKFDTIKNLIIDMQSILPSVPTEKISDWRFDGFSDSILKMLPQLNFVFSYEFEKDSKLSDEKNVVFAPNSDGLTKTTDNVLAANVCSRYNNSIFSALELAKDICQIKLMIENIDTSKKYSLTTNMLKILGY